METLGTRICVEEREWLLRIERTKEGSVVLQPRLFDAPGVDFAPETVVEDHGVATFDPYFLEPTFGEKLFHELHEQIEWRQDFLSMYGRRIAFPRLTAWYGDAGASYSYSGVSNQPSAWTRPLKDLRDRLRRTTRVRFNSVLLNLYRNGKDSLSWHADNERELGAAPVIASISLGEPRTFQLKNRETGQITSLSLTHGSLLLMSGELQRHWLHCIPKERKVTRPRINLTFRVIDARKHEKVLIQPR